MRIIGFLSLFALISFNGAEAHAESRKVAEAKALWMSVIHKCRGEASCEEWVASADSDSRLPFYFCGPTDRIAGLSYPSALFQHAGLGHLTKLPAWKKQANYCIRGGGGCTVRCLLSY